LQERLLFAILTAILKLLSGKLFLKLIEMLKIRPHLVLIEVQEQKARLFLEVPQKVFLSIPLQTKNNSLGFTLNQVEPSLFPLNNDKYNLIINLDETVRGFGVLGFWGFGFRV
jgi:hypothetical protein